MLAKLKTVALLGLEGYPVALEVDISSDLPACAIVGLPDAAVQQTKEVEEARSLQLERFNGRGTSLNNEMAPTSVRRFCAADDSAQALLKVAMAKHSLSARGFHGILNMAHTIADLEKNDIIKVHYLAEAIQYRPRWAV